MGFIFPLMYAFSSVSLWGYLYACTLNSLGMIALLSAACLLVPSFWWKSFTPCQKRAPPSSAGNRCDWPLRVVFTVITELSFLPGLLFLFALELLLDCCGGNWHESARGANVSGDGRDPLVHSPQPKIILLHGAGINQCQWVAARHLLHLHGFRDVYSINYFTGILHINAENNGVPEFAKVAVQKIKQLDLQAGADVWLIGHSLGGLVSAHIAEKSGDDPLENNLRIRSIICVSSPLVGSSLLACLRTRLPECIVQCTRPEVLDSWMVPDSAKLEQLRECVTNKNRIDKYKFLTGQLDAMVRPDSALLEESLDICAQHRVRLPHLDHYNIAASPWAWAKIAQWIHEEANQDAP